MTSSAAESAPETRASDVPAPKALPEVVLTLVRREFWEHRYLWLAPAVVAALIALCAVLGDREVDIKNNVSWEGMPSHPQRVAISSMLQWILAMPLYVVLLFLISYYALDCLYAERKDRSILFWKSLPVSDALTVGSKLLVALVVAPLVVFVLAIVTHLVFEAIVAARIAAGNLPPLIEWSSFEWLRTETVMLLLLGLAMLWYAPLAAALMLVSAWARRSPFLWATLPPVLAPILERMALGTHYLWDFYRYRTTGIWHVLTDGYHWGLITHHDVQPVGTLFDELQFAAAYSNIDLWLGVLATGAILFLAVRIRRYRDDT
jgi:ABC-2 type transport system permease protein